MSSTLYEKPLYDSEKSVIHYLQGRRKGDCKMPVKGDFAFFAVILPALSTPEYTVTAI